MQMLYLFYTSLQKTAKLQTKVDNKDCKIHDRVLLLTSVQNQFYCPQVLKVQLYQLTSTYTLKPWKTIK